MPEALAAAAINAVAGWLPSVSLRTMAPWRRGNGHTWSLSMQTVSACIYSIPSRLVVLLQYYYLYKQHLFSLVPITVCCSWKFGNCHLCIIICMVIPHQTAEFEYFQWGFWDQAPLIIINNLIPADNAFNYYSGVSIFMQVGTLGVSVWSRQVEQCIQMESKINLIHNLESLTHITTLSQNILKLAAFLLAMMT